MSPLYYSLTLIMLTYLCLCSFKMSFFTWKKNIMKPSKKELVCTLGEAIQFYQQLLCHLMPTRLTPALQLIGGRGPEPLRSFYPGHKGGREEPVTLHSSGRALRLADFPGVTFLQYLPPPNASLCNHHCSAERDHCL